jgi:RecJ-like exonuclease
MRTHLAVHAMLIAGVLVATTSAQAPTPPAPAAIAQAPATPLSEGYVWAEACKVCHGAVYQAWHDTKHARTITRLSAADKDTACVGCHVTGPKQVLTEGEVHLNANVQCESCHGPGKAHIEAATAGSARPGHVVASPGQPVCESCHNDQSPHYRGFFFSALKGLVHKVPK